MNFDKAFVLVGILLSSILVIENLVTGISAYVFLSTSSKAGTLAFVSVMIGCMIGYGLRGLMTKKDTSPEEHEFDY